MFEGAEVPQSDLVKDAAKGVQAVGLGVSLKGSEFEVNAPQGVDISPTKLKLISDFINFESDAHNLLGASPESRGAIATALGTLGGSGFREDLVAYGPPVVGDSQGRLARLEVARATITAAQHESQRDPKIKDKAGLIRAATFARRNISNLGLGITQGVLLAGSDQAQGNGTEILKKETFSDREIPEEDEKKQRERLKERDIAFFGSRSAVPESRRRRWESRNEERDIAFYGSRSAVPESRKRRW